MSSAVCSAQAIAFGTRRGRAARKFAFILPHIILDRVDRKYRILHGSLADQFAGLFGSFALTPTITQPTALLPYSITRSRSVRTSRMSVSISLSKQCRRLRNGRRQREA